MNKIACLFLLFAVVACSKSSNPPVVSTKPYLAVYKSGAYNSILLIDFNTTQYKYLDVVGGSGVVYRQNIDKNYDLVALANDKYCKWKINRALDNVVILDPGNSLQSLDGEEVVVQVDKKSQEYMAVAKGGTVMGQPEYYVTTNYYSVRPKPIPDQIKFILHKVGEKGDIDIYTIESKFYPGYYLDNIGHTLTANGVRLTSFTSAGAATKFEFH